MQLPAARIEAFGTRVFQSSPAREGECNNRASWLRWCTTSRFQSSPAREGECNPVRAVPIGPLASRFNPHPPVRASATTSSSCATSAAPMFQSSPAREGECNVA